MGAAVWRPRCHVLRTRRIHEDDHQPAELRHNRALNSGAREGRGSGRLPPHLCSFRIALQACQSPPKNAMAEPVSRSQLGHPSAFRPEYVPRTAAPMAMAAHIRVLPIRRLPPYPLRARLNRVQSDLMSYYESWSSNVRYVLMSSVRKPILRALIRPHGQPGPAH